MAFDIDRAPARLISFRPFRSRPQKDGSTTMFYAMKVSINVSDGESMAKVDKMLPGAVLLGQKISGEDGAGGELRGRSKLGVCMFKLMDPTGKVIVESPTAKAGQPRLDISRRALESFLVVPLLVHIPRDGVLQLHDYYQAHAMCSLATSQLTIEDKPRGTSKRGGKKNTKADLAHEQTDLETADA